MAERIFEETEHLLSLTQHRPAYRSFPFLNQLNPTQFEAVTSQARLLLVLAGAGSGKTRVLICRIAWLILDGGFNSEQILAVTFTNKAASEMRQRLAKMFNMSGKRFWVGTFHGISHRLLRLHSREAELPEEFRVIDNKEQELLLKEIITDLKLDSKIWKADDIKTYINNQKDKGRRAVSLHNSNSIEDPIKFTKCQIYEMYEMRCNREGLVDFAELLLRSYELLRNNAELLDYYRNRFRHVLVDEFQDTSRIQYDWLRMLNGDHNHITIVGDDDQSIYRWRGARVENVGNFIKDFGDTAMITLDQNYRSTSTILDAANTVISYNQKRLGKRLWTEGERGELITLYAAYDDNSEASYVVHTIYENCRKGVNPADIAILYRANSQYRILEKALIYRGIPYRIYGGRRFFDRLEIKEALAYLRLMASPYDNLAFEQVYNVPKRKIGETTFKKIREFARSGEQSYWDASISLIQTRALSGRSLSGLKEFLKLIETLKQSTENRSLADMIDEVINTTGLINYYEEEKAGKGKARADNLRELVKIASEFTPEEGEKNSLTSFLNTVVLDASDMGGYNANAVQLMTLHSAKGLEFPIVFIVGLEENLFPAYQSIDDPEGLEEERRLCYVGITRAMKKLYLSYSGNRMLYGETRQKVASRFLNEIPRSLIECIL